MYKMYIKGDEGEGRKGRWKEVRRERRKDVKKREKYRKKNRKNVGVREREEN